MSWTTAQTYAVCIEGTLDASWSTWFDGMTIVAAAARTHTTTLIGLVRDQAELHGLLCKIRDLNLTLISVQHIGARPGACSCTPTAHCNKTS